MANISALRQKVESLRQKVRKTRAEWDFLRNRYNLLRGKAPNAVVDTLKKAVTAKYNEYKRAVLEFNRAMKELSEAIAQENKSRSQKARSSNRSTAPTYKPVRREESETRATKCTSRTVAKIDWTVPLEANGQIRDEEAEAKRLMNYINSRWPGAISGIEEAKKLIRFAPQYRVLRTGYMMVRVYRKTDCGYGVQVSESPTYEKKKAEIQRQKEEQDKKNILAKIEKYMKQGDISRAKRWYDVGKSRYKDFPDIPALNASKQEIKELEKKVLQQKRQEEAVQKREQKQEALPPAEQKPERKEVPEQKQPPEEVISVLPFITSQQPEVGALPMPEGAELTPAIEEKKEIKVEKPKPNIEKLLPIIGLGLSAVGIALGIAQLRRG